MNREAITSALQRGELELLRVLWCDNANVIRVKSIFLPTFLAGLDDLHSSDDLLDRLEHQITITAAVQSLPVTMDAPAAGAGLAPVQDIRLVPDWDSFCVSPVTPSLASVIGDMMDGETPWAVCPRDFLQRTVQRASDLGVTLEAGMEIEFFLLRPADDPAVFPTPVDRTLYAATASAQKNAQVIGDILRSLWKQGIPVAQYNPESGPGQQEITLQHCAPLDLANRLVLARETIRAVAYEHGLIATLIPELFDDATGSGLHTHFSLWKDGQNLLPDAQQKWNLAPLANAFMAGVLDHLPALMAATTPSVNSYRRIRPHEWSGAYQAWGIANKEAALRLITDPKLGLPTHFELKTVDGSANPYIALGAVITAGLDGIERKLRLPEPVEIDPGDYSDEQRKQAKIAPLPNHLEQSLAAFESDTALRAGMGEVFARVFAAVRRAELEGMREMSLDEERLVLLERY